MLRLPSDTSLGVFYAPSILLGIIPSSYPTDTIVCTIYTIYNTIYNTIHNIGVIATTRVCLALPVLRIKRMSSMDIRKILNNSVIIKWSIPRSYDEYTFVDNMSINKYNSIYLFNSVDGKGLALGTHSYLINNWITYPINMFSGRDFIDMVNLKHGLQYIGLQYIHYICRSVSEYK